MKTSKYTIKWYHHHPKENDGVEYTECIIEDAEKKVSAVAFCHPADTFSRDTGRRLSLARGLKSLSLGKEEKREIWEAYRLMTPTGRW